MHESVSAIAIIQARMSSSRLPGKVLKYLAGRPMIWHIVERARACQRVEKVIVATSNEASDDPLADFCQASDIPCFRGSLHNVLGRYLAVLDRYPAPYYVRITGDCPLIDPDFIDKQLVALERHGADHVWLDPPVSVLVGQGAHSTRSLQWIAQQTDDPDDFEHVGAPYVAQHPDAFRIVGMSPPQKLVEAKWRVTVDEQADYEMMQQLYAALWKGVPITLDEALEWMARNPLVAGHNLSVQDSAINQRLSAERRARAPGMDLLYSWENPSIAANIGSLLKP
ncbi:MAG: cytidylyltransferase domain-containing protein [Halothiobacillaceae bacterium]